VGDRRRKAPYVIKHRDGSPLAFAGLWEVWHDAEDEPLRTCVIITTDRRQQTVTSHPRQGAGDIAAQGLRPVVGSRVRRHTGLQKLLVPAPAKEFGAYEISTRVNNVRNEGPELIEPNRG
jgi:putative SOS response-associated peptidase YedK